MKILIVDDHQVVRAGTRFLLQESGNDFDCDEASDCCEALLKVRANDYDVMLLGLSLPELAGFETLYRLKREKPGIPVVVISMHSDQQYAVKSYALEAEGYIDEDNSIEDLIFAIEKVVQGGIFISDHLMGKVLTGLLSGKAAEQVSSNMKQLSKREEQVVQLLVSGATNKEIAWHLSLSIKTISTYKMRILEKLNLKNLVELVKYQLSHARSDFPVESHGAPFQHRSS